MEQGHDQGGLGDLVCVSRDAELATIRKALSSAVRTVSTVVVVQGKSGVGRTTLLKAGAQLADEMGFRVLTARGAAIERDLPYELTTQLFGPVAGKLVDHCPRAQQELMRELHQTLRKLAAQAPVLVAIDNLDLADPESLQVLSYLRRRLDGLPVAVIVTSAPGRLPEFARDAYRILLNGLDTKACGALAAAWLPTEPDPEFVAVCHAATAGNPRLLTAVLSDVCARELTPNAATATQVCRNPPPELANDLIAPLQEAGPDVTALGRAIAHLSGADIVLAAVAADLDYDSAITALQVLADLGCCPAAEPLTLAHPVLTAALRTSSSAAHRSQLRLRAARHLSQRHAPAAEIADQLVATAALGDNWTQRQLLHLAHTASSEGDPELAIHCLRRLLAEPLSDEYRRVVLGRLGAAETHTDPDAALSHLTQAGASTDGHTVVALAHAMADRGRVEEALAVLDNAFQHTADVSVELYSRSLRLECSSKPPRPIPDRPAVAMSPPLKRLHHGLTAVTRAQAGTQLGAARDQVTAALSADPGRGLAIGVSGDLLDHRALLHLVTSLALMDEFAEAERLCEDVLTAVADLHRPVAYGLALGLKSQLVLRRGDLRAIEALAPLGPEEHPLALSAVVGAFVDAGCPTAAAELLRDRNMDGPVPRVARYEPVLHQRGRLHALLGDDVSAVRDQLECGRRMVARGATNPAACPWRSHAAQSLARLGERDQALALAEQEVGLAKAWGAATALGVALHGAGTVIGGVRGGHLLADSVATLKESPARLAFARALVDWGGYLRESGDNVTARSVLQQSYDSAKRCGAIPLMGRAAQELRLAGGRRRFADVDPTALTDREAHIARRAAEGRTNRQIADELYVTTRSVEFHLTRAYRKLDVSGRMQLRDALTDTRGAEPEH